MRCILKQFVEYSKKFDFIRGFEDLGHYRSTNKSANCSIFYGQRYLFTMENSNCIFFFSLWCTKNIYKNVILDILKKSFNIGLCPKIIVCDHGTNNQSTLKSLIVSEHRPFFFNNINIFSLFDVPHLLKSIKNNIINALLYKR